MKKTIKLNVQNVYSKYESARIKAGFAELKYLAPSTKRIREIQRYSESIMESDYIDLDVKRSAMMLRMECKQEFAVRRLITRYKHCFGG